MTTAVARDPVLLIKLTPGAASEGRALADGRGAVQLLDGRSSARQLQRAGAIVIRDAPQPDQIVHGGRRYRLAADADRRAFCAALGLRGVAAARVSDALARAEPDARDELAGLARALHLAEQGATRLRRVVISGHAAENRVVRGNFPGAPHEGRPYNGALGLEPLRLLVSAFPRAAAQVEHLMLAVCFSAQRGWLPQGDDPLRTYRSLFPRLRSVTGYSARAPRSGAGAEGDLRRWARATRGAALPRREQVFGACVAEPRTPAELRRSGGTVLGDAAAQRCAFRLRGHF